MLIGARTFDRIVAATRQQARASAFFEASLAIFEAHHKGLVNGIKSHLNGCDCLAIAAQIRRIGDNVHRGEA